VELNTSLEHDPAAVHISTLLPEMLTQPPV
jgi:hypothetical protein